MRITEYDALVTLSDQYREREEEERLRIAVYGIASEIGSILSIVKKGVLNEFGPRGTGRTKDAVAEEIGDVIWYCFSLAQIVNDGRPVDILVDDIKQLKRTLKADDQSAELFRAALSRDNLDAFLEGAAEFPRLRNREFDHYQILAFKTARTEKDVLLTVCLSVLWQLSAELMRMFLPDDEKKINQQLPDRSPNKVIGEIAWHLSAIATLYDLSLNSVMAKNAKKIGFRTNREQSTPLHDDDEAAKAAGQQFPRQFEIKIVSVAEDRSRMYYNNRQLGDDLTDNHYDGDGYRFHDVMHLANAAKLGWSPVLRGMLGLKRKYNPKKDEVEDGARAKIVEEAIIKTIHSEAVKLTDDEDPSVAKLFTDREQISFGFLKFLRGLVSGLEVEKNAYWEWEDAIFEGYQIFNALRDARQGTVSIDLEERKIRFSEEVHIDLNGTVSGFGSCSLEQQKGKTFHGHPFTRLLNETERASIKGGVEEEMRLIAAKAAILQALGMAENSLPAYELFDVTLLVGGAVSVRAKGKVQREIWKREVISFKASFSQTQISLGCSVLAVADSA